MAMPIVQMIFGIVVPIPLPPTIKKKLEEWEENSKSVSILVTGKTGTGKSTLVNTLVGKRVAHEGDSLDPDTTEVNFHDFEVDGVAVKVWDSPGLQDGTTNEARYLNDIQQNCQDVDLFVYCIRMSDSFDRQGKDVEAMKKLTEALGTELWKNAIFVVTFANDVVATARGKGQDVEAVFTRKLDSWKKRVPTRLHKEVGLPEELAKSINVVPAGYHTELMLPIKESPYWLTKLWLRALLATKSRAQPAMIKINRHRFKELETQDSEEAKDTTAQQELISGQDLIFEKKGMEFCEEQGIDPELGQLCGKCKSQGKNSIALMIELAVINNIVPSGIDQRQDEDTERKG